MSARPIARLRRRLAALEPHEVDDDIGGRTRSFVERFEIWAEIEHLGSMSRFSARREEVEATHRIHIRAGSAVAAGWRLRDGERVFDLLAVTDDDVSAGFATCTARETS